MDLLAKLPDDATWGDVQYAVVVRQTIAAGLKDAEEGRVVPQEEVEKRFAS